MKNVQNFHRKRPHMLPPLPGLPSPALAPTAPLLPPDLLQLASRLGSPAPKRNDPTEYDYFHDGNNGKPMIKIFKIPSKESEKCKLKFDLISDSVLKEEIDSTHKIQKKNSFNLCELESKLSDRENLKDFPRKKFDYLRDDLHKKLKFHSILPLEENKDLKIIAEHKILSIPSRYTLLKPIGQDQIEN